MKTLLLLREKALANAIALFSYWKLDFIKVNEDEYDFINPTRDDTNFGACRFNIRKGLGADFTGASFTENDFKQIGMGFSREDFGNIQGGKSINFGFDIIGLVQRLYACPTYKDAARLLNKQLADLSKTQTLETVDLSVAIKRQQETQDNNLKRIKIARRTWEICVPIHKTLGQTYLNSRMISLEPEEPTMRYHPKIFNKEVGKPIPALLLKCTRQLDTDLLAIHRIYLDPSSGKKADVSIQKSALGGIKGLGIWLWKKSKENDSNNYSTKNSTNGYSEQPNTSNFDTLCIVEGPENALTIRNLGYNFVVSTINAGNFANIEIPEYVKKIILFPDGDEAGHKAAEKAIITYKKVLEDVNIIFPPKNPNNPKWDWNDELMSRGTNNGRRNG